MEEQPSERACALLRGSAVNQDGRSSSLTAPNGPSQSSLIAATLHAAGASTGPSAHDYSLANANAADISDSRESSPAARGGAPGGMSAWPAWSVLAPFAKPVFTLSSMAGMGASEVAFVAVHGTGTPLGDPIELGALGQALAASPGPTPQLLTLGAVKSCYGHTEGAAGLTGALLAIHAVGQQVVMLADLASWQLWFLLGLVVCCAP